MEPKNRLAEILKDLGIQEIKLEESMLSEMQISQRRFTKLVKNTAKLPMKVTEANSIRKWLQKNFKGTNIYLFEQDMPAELRNRQSKLNL